MRISRLMVNGQEINIFPTSEIKHLVYVKPGTNTFTVVAMDANYNVAETTLTIHCTTAAPVVLTLDRTNPAIGLDQPAIAKGGRTLVPFRWFGEYVLGAKVDYMEVNGFGIVTLVKAGVEVELALGSNIARVNDQPIALDVAAQALNGRAYVPARFLAETFGYTITWDAATNNVTISK